MTGWMDTPSREGWPDDMWAVLPKAGSVYLLKLYSPILPKGFPSGVWGHNVMLPGRTRPIYAPCAGQEACAFCKANAEANGDKPFPSRRLAWAIGAVVATISGGVNWLQAPKIGLVERGPEFWSTLARAEAMAAQPDELNPAKPLLPADWCEWLFRVEARERGISAVAIANIPGHDFPPLSEERMLYWKVLLEKRVRPWTDADAVVKKVLGTKEAKESKQAYAESSFANAGPAPTKTSSELVEEYARLRSLPLRGKDGKSQANWEQLIRFWKGPKYGRGTDEPLSFAELNDADKEDVLSFICKQAIAQGYDPDVSVGNAEEIPF